MRDLLKAMARIERRQQDLVGWEGHAERIYLHHHEHLLWPLRQCAPLVGEDMQPLAFVPESVGIVLDLTADPDKAPPAIWEAFFAKTLARIAPLKLEPDYIVLKVSADEEIRRLFASDPALRELALKVEGLRIAVRGSDLKKLAKRLEQFGYLSPVPRLTSGR